MLSQKQVRPRTSIQRIRSPLLLILAVIIAFSQLIMHRIWQIPELLIHIVSFLPADDIGRTLYISRQFRTLLKTNLPPQLRPLPDGRPKHSSVNDEIPQDVREKAQAYIAQEAATPKQLKMEDAYYYWREDARCQVLDTLSPHLHPFLNKYSTRLVDGYESLAAGSMSIQLQTEIPYHTLYTIVHGEDQKDLDAFLAVMPPTSATVFCLGGVQWDLLYANVKYKDYGGIERFSIRVEREKGVRMQDVLEELSGTLVKEGMSGGFGQDVVLMWVLDDESGL